MSDNKLTEQVQTGEIVETRPKSVDFSVLTEDQVKELDQIDQSTLPVITEQPSEIVLSGNKHNLTIRQLDFLSIYISCEGNLSKSVKTYSEAFRQRLSPLTAAKWLQTDAAKQYLLQKLEDMGYDKTMTKERWVKETLEFRDSVGRLDKTGCFMHKLLGLAKGFIATGSSQTTNIDKQQINFLQSNGKEV